MFFFSFLDLQQLNILFFVKTLQLLGKEKRLNVILKVKIKIALLLNSEILEEALACFCNLAISRATDVLLDYWTFNHGCLLCC